MGMLFRPSFCANCGEKIERAEWRIWTSRRFCEVCETDFKGHDLIPRVIVGLGLLLGVLGVGGYLKGGAAVDRAVTDQTKKIAGKPASTTNPDESARVLQSSDATLSDSPTSERRVSNTVPRALTGSPTGTNASKPTVDEPLYFCGAATKKGTPCSRRVKGNVRCFQHQGMPAMLPSEKLRAG